MTYTVVLTRAALKQLRSLDSTIRGRIWAQIRALENDPRPPGCKRLKGQDSWRIRVGDYRILYTIDDDKLIVEVFRIGHRGDVY